MRKKHVIIYAAVILIGIGMIGTSGDDSSDSKTTETTTKESDEPQIENEDVDVTDEEEAETEEVENEKEPVQEPAEEPAEDPVEEILTVDNCEELLNLLQVKDFTGIKEFAEKYKGRTVEFDANIAYISYHENYTTRYDILIYAGDYSETDVKGPNFQFNDVNTFDLGIEDLFLPSFVSAGNNIHLVAKVEEYNEVSSLFKLDPVLIEPR